MSRVRLLTVCEMSGAVPAPSHLLDASYTPIFLGNTWKTYGGSLTLLLHDVTAGTLIANCNDIFATNVCSGKMGFRNVCNA